MTTDKANISNIVAPKKDLWRLLYWSVILIATLLAVAFDRAAHQNELTRYHGEAPGDFLTFRAYAVLATQPHAAHVAAPFLYPPPFLLVTAPLSWLPPVQGYLAWIFFGILGLALVARSIKIPWKAICLGLLAAPTLFCAVTGQSGILVSCFLLAAFGLAQTQPIIAGIAAGMVIIKPQFGLLIPICFLAMRNWRAIISAAVTASLLCLLTAICFGDGVWQSFLANHSANWSAMLAAPWPTRFQIMMISPFIMFRSLQASLTAAALGQAAVTLLSAFACWRLWGRHKPAVFQLAPTLCLVALATPYAYIYDLPAVCMALAALSVVEPRRGLPAYALLLSFTCLYGLISVYFVSTGAVFLLIIFLLTLPHAKEIA